VTVKIRLLPVTEYFRWASSRTIQRA